MLTLTQNAATGGSPDRAYHLALGHAISAIIGAADASDEARRAVQGAAIAPDRLGPIYESMLGMAPVADPAGHARLMLAPASASVRRSRGVFYTPDSLVKHLLRGSLAPAIEEAVRGRTGADAERALLDLRICDPACGSGRFLIPAARMIARSVAEARSRGASPNAEACRAATGDVARRCIFGVDLDPVAVAICRHVLAAEAGIADSASLGNIRPGNALLSAPFEQCGDRSSADAWCAAFFRERGEEGSDARIASDLGFFHWPIEFPTLRDGFDVIAGNPPFLNQLQTATASSRAVAALLEARSAGVLRRYADTAAAFLLLAVELARPGGRVCLVQPQSLLATEDAAPVRRALLARASLESLWVSNAHVFESAGVFTCAPTLRIAGPRVTRLALSTGADFGPSGPIELDNDVLASSPTWAHLAADAAGVPSITITGGPDLSTVAFATADFRDQYYGLEGCLIEDAALDPAARDDAAYPPVITTGMIDLAQSRWGRDHARIHKQRWEAPRVDRAALRATTTLGPWLAARLVPKIILATQTRIIEVFVDEDGRYAPCVPLITVTPKDSARLWHIAAALASPVAAAIALRRYAGAALSAGAIKLSAKQAMTLPLPADEEAWDEAALRLRAAHAATDPAARRGELLLYARAACRATTLPEESATGLLAWWTSRLGG